jgi:prevent-host-death family protein
MSSSTIRIRNARGELVEPAKVSSSDAKNRFGKILERVTEEGGVAITLRNEAKFVVISVETYQRLARADARSLNTLADEFDALLDRMQEPGQRKAMERAFNMTPVELGRVARKHDGAVAGGQVAAAPSSRARKGTTLASGMAVPKVVGKVRTKARDVYPLLQRSAAKKAKKRSARG